MEWPAWRLPYDGRVPLQLAILAVGLLVGWGLGGGIRRLGHVHLRLWPVAVVALAIQVVPAGVLGGRFDELLDVRALLVSYLMLLAVAAINWRCPGFPLIVVGLVLNFTVIAVNRGMPVSEEALRRAGRQEDVRVLSEARDSKHHLARDDDLLLPLADVIPVGPPFASVVSVGDLLTYTGAATFLAGAMLDRPGRRRRESAGPRARTATTSGTRQ